MQKTASKNISYEFLQIYLRDFSILWPKMGLKMCQNQFFANISKSKGPGA